MRYFAKITKQSEGGYLVVFPELSGCVTEGETLKEAQANAQELLNGWPVRNLCARRPARHYFLLLK